MFRNGHTSNLSDEFHRLQARLTSDPKPASSSSASYASMPVLAPVPFTSPHGDTLPDNPIKEVHFPHARPLGSPGTTKCVGRPGRPALAVNTDVPAVSIPRIATRYGTPWRSAAPARYGPPELSSEQMGSWLKGTREEEDKEILERAAWGGSSGGEDREGTWGETGPDSGADGEDEAVDSQEKTGGHGGGKAKQGGLGRSLADRWIWRENVNRELGMQILNEETLARRNAVALGTKLATEQGAEGYWGYWEE